MPQIPLSASVNGRAITVTNSLTTLHTAQSGTAGVDAVYIFATNQDSSARTIIISHGGTNIADRVVFNQSIPTGGHLVAVVAGLILQNSLVVQAAVNGANPQNVVFTGYVIR